MFSKDLIIGILITYIMMDILVGIIIYQNNPEILVNIKQSIGSDSKLLIIVVIASAIGCVCSNCFGYKKIF